MILKMTPSYEEAGLVSCLIDQESPFINSFSCCSRPQSLWCPTNHQHRQLRLLSCLSGVICLGKVVTHFRRRSGSPCDSQWYGCLPHELNKPKAPPKAELLSLHRGQGLEILWRDSLTCPSEEEYIDMVNNSASYFR